MHVLIAYDIGDAALRGRLFAWLKERGVHSQKSVFECEMDGEGLRQALDFMRALPIEKKDSILIYPLCGRCARQCVILGKGDVLAREEWTIV